MKQKIKKVLFCFHRQRPLITLLTVLTGTALVIGSTYSWFIQSDHVTNTLQTQKISFRLDLQEEFTPPGVVDPGQQVPKVVTVVNTGDISGFVRIMAFATITAQDGTPLEATPGVTFTYGGLNVTDWSAGNASLWADGGDGYYYYLGKLKPGETTAQPLFSGVTPASGLATEYENAGMKIEIKAEASETIRAKYRDGWWRNGDNPPVGSALIMIDNVLKELTQV